METKKESAEDTSGEPSGSPNATTKRASFAGQLSITDFLYSSGAPGSEAIRKSPRKANDTVSATPTPRIESPKRKWNADGSTPSSPPKRRVQKGESKTPSGYAPPSKYAHLPLLRDVITPDLLCLFVGLNPGIQTAASGHAYAHPSNLFWRLLHSSGCTTRRCSPTEDGDLPRLFQLGNTNIVGRPTRNGAELSKAEMDAGVQVLEDKVRHFRPKAVCIVGKSIWESVWRVRRGRPIKKEEFKYGWQNDTENLGSEKSGEQQWDGAKVFVATTTSGLAASLSLMEKERIWRELGSWVENRRKERLAIKEEV